MREITNRLVKTQYWKPIVKNINFLHNYLSVLDDLNISPINVKASFQWLKYHFPCCRWDIDLVPSPPIGTVFEPQNALLSLQAGCATMCMFFLFKIIFS